MIDFFFQMISLYDIYIFAFNSIARKVKHMSREAVPQTLMVITQLKIDNGYTVKIVGVQLSLCWMI